ncbi:MAG TPA: Hsp20/alpha crystallin family protein [Gammaproteobacteria bacterium]|nr:Hsp20/alpha crystallin family protein [Gammaproteobacteria bacterium]
MSKILLLVALLVSTSINAHGPFQSGFFNQGFNDGFWRNFDQQFQQLDRQINQINRSNSAFSTQSRQYFDQDNNRYVIEIKISGLNKNDLDITSNKNMLVIKGSQSQQKTSNNQRSRSSSSFSHAVSIPADGDKDNISADFKNGVLKVSIPKLDKPKPEVQKITIQ